MSKILVSSSELGHKADKVDGISLLFSLRLCVSIDCLSMEDATYSLFSHLMAFILFILFYFVVPFQARQAFCH
jgi:hypothetical protein